MEITPNKKDYPGKTRGYRKQKETAKKRGEKKGNDPKCERGLG